MCASSDSQSHMSSLTTRLRQALQSRQDRLNLRSLDPEPNWSKVDPSFDNPHVNCNNPAIQPGSTTALEELIDFSSNDYLSLSRSTALREAFQEKLINSKESPLGPSSSRLLDGNTPLHRTLEQDLTEFFDGQSGLLFNSGYDANVGIWSTIPGPMDWIVYDNLIHASVHDGLRLSRTRVERRRSFRHNSTDALQQELEFIRSQDPAVSNGSASVFVGVESLYSMDGDICPLKDIVRVIESVFGEHQNAYLVVDEAHSTGLYGQFGQGLACALSLTGKILIRLHTFGKVVACSGAIVLAPPLLRDFLINYARPLIFSTTMTHMNVIAIGTVISEFKSERRLLAVNNLSELAGYLSRKLGQLLEKHRIRPIVATLPRSSDVILTIPQSSLDVPHDGLFSPIVPVLSQEPRDLARFLYRCGLLLRPIGTPTVPAGREQVRICLHARQTMQQIDYLVQQIDRWILLRRAQSRL